MAGNTKLFLAVLHRHFPHAPRTLGQFYFRLWMLVVLLITMAVFIYVEPFQRKLGMEALWLQFIGAALLWREANSVEQVDLAVEEMSAYPLSLPGTPAERILHRVSIVSSYVPTALGLTAVVLGVAALSEQRGWRVLLLNEAKAVIFVLVVVALMVWGGRLLDRQQAKVAKRIREAEHQGRVAQRDIARQALRTLGFALIAVATFLQFILLWADTTPKP